MKKCPECKGNGTSRIIIDESYYWEEGGGLVFETVDCDLCNGDKEISDLEYAIYKARGGMPVSKISGFA